MEPCNLVLQGLVLSLLLFLMGANNVYTRAEERRWYGKGTNPYLESIFLGRCGNYISKVNPKLSEKNCSAIWEAFKYLLHKDPCSVLPSDYDLFMNLSKHSIPRDKSLFWENNQFLVLTYTDKGRRLISVGDMLYGTVADLMSWCPKENGSNFDYQSCPTDYDCENNAVTSFWRRASTQYAHDSSGVMYVMLNGSEPSGAYPVQGFFADYEIPNIQKDKVTKFEIWVMHKIGGPYLESCGEGSMRILEDRLQSMKFKFECINDYIPVKLLKCVDYADHPECAFTLGAESAQQRLPSIFGGKWNPSLVFFLFLALASGIQI